MRKHTCSTRRRFNQGVALAVIGSIAGSGISLHGSTPVLAVDDLSWVANGATIASADGEISEVVFGDAEGEDDDAIQVSYEGWDEVPVTAVFEIRVRGTDEGDGAWSGGSDETGWELLASDSIEIGQTTGETTYLWDEIFGEPTPVDVTDHSEITLDDFEAPEGGTTTEQVLEIEVRVSLPDEGGISASESTTATVSVTNPTSTILIGFEDGQFDNSGGADETLFMTDGSAEPEPVDVDVTAFNSATMTLNGAGGAASDRASARGPCSRGGPANRRLTLAARASRSATGWQT